MSRKGQVLQAGHLMTLEERRDLRFIAVDLEAQIARCHDTERFATLERQLENVRRQQREDKALSPRRKRGGAK